MTGSSRRQPEPLAVAAPRPAVGQPAGLADLRRRLLLQDLHVAGEILGGDLRAADPPRRRPWPRGGQRRSRPLREGLGALRRAGRRRRAGRPFGSTCRRPRRRARHPVRGRFRARRPAAQRRRHDRRHAGCRLARPHAWPSSTPLPDVRIMRRTTVFGVYDGGTYAALERVNDHLPSPPRAPAAAAAVADRGEALRSSRPAPSSGRSCLPGNDTPGVMMASAMRTYIDALRRGAGKAHRAVHQQRRMAGARSRPRSARGCRSPPSIDARPDISPAASRAGGEDRLSPCSTVRCRAVTGGKRRRSQDIGGARRRRARRGRGRRAGRFRRLEPGGRPDLISSRPAEMARRHRRLRAGRRAAGHAGSRRCQRRPSRLGACLREGLLAGAAAAADAGLNGKCRFAAGRRRRGVFADAALARRRQRQRPSSTCRTT